MTQKKDNARTLAVIAARESLPEGTAIGRQVLFKMKDGTDRTATIVDVIEDARLVDLAVFPAPRDAQNATPFAARAEHGEAAGRFRFPNYRAQLPVPASSAPEQAAPAKAKKTKKTSPA